MLYKEEYRWITWTGIRMNEMMNLMMKMMDLDELSELVGE